MRFHYNNIRAIPLLMKYVFILLKWKSHDGVRGRDVCLCTCTTAQCEQSAYKCACAFVYVCEMLARRIPKIVANGRGAPPPPPLPIAFHFNHFSINFEFEHFHVLYDRRRLRIHFSFFLALKSHKCRDWQKKATHEIVRADSVLMGQKKYLRNN